MGLNPLKNRFLPVFLLLLLSICILLLSQGREGRSEQNQPGKQTASAGQNSPGSETLPPPEPLYHYFNIKENETNFDLSMHVLEIDPSNPSAMVRPVTSHKTLFGYALLSGMNEEWNAEASINGGFSHPDGLLGGLYSTGGELLVPATGQYPVLFMKDGKAFLDDATTKIWIEEAKNSDETGLKAGLDEKQASGTILPQNFYYNKFPEGAGLYIFTPSYGSQNRIGKPHLNAVISDGEVQGIMMKNSTCEIPEDGFLISAVGDSPEKKLKEAVRPGMKLRIQYEIETSNGKTSDYDWAYECGSWILRGGKVVVPDYDGWVGTLTIRTPRTAVGIKDDGTLVFVVADGRQKGLSDGLSGEELAIRLSELGIRDAAFLDGGASSEMIIQNRIVNSPSAGRERMMASCFVVLKTGP